MPISVYMLALCNAYMFICSSLLITLSALIGFQLAPVKTLATLPMALQFLAIMLVSFPASMLMGRIGRKYGFILASLIGITGALIATWSIFNSNFWAFCLATFCFGSFNAFGNFYRFTAAELVTSEKRSTAISYVMAGGVIAAFIGPNLATISHNLIPDYQFAGAFAVLIGVYLLSLVTISLAKLPPAAPASSRRGGRPLWEIATQPVFIVAVICEMLGYGTMNLVMTSTPLAMQVMEHGIANTAFVIQWHVVSMFLPSFFTGHLIKRFGIVSVLGTGALLGLLCVGVNLMGTTVAHFTTGLVLLGVCWNFLFVGGTTLLTEAYRPEEKNRAQGFNDFLVFSTVTITALCAGGMHHLFGWRVVNFSVIPLFLLCLAGITWLYLIQRRSATVA
ncbi:MAG: MFS transporter [Gammaproteobacteria bacterium]|nr:MFS transporter [Gammaproteobacteria bacterium]